MGGFKGIDQRLHIAVAQEGVRQGDGQFRSLTDITYASKLLLYRGGRIGIRRSQCGHRFVKAFGEDRIDGGDINTRL